MLFNVDLILLLIVLERKPAKSKRYRSTFVHTPFSHVLSSI